MEPAIICRSTSPVIVCQGFQDQAARVSIKEETVDAKKNFGLSSLELFLLLLPPSPCPSLSQSISPTSPFLLLLLPPHPPPPPSTPYYKFSPSTPSPSSPHFSSVFYSFFLFLLFLSLVFPLRRPSFPWVSCRPPFPLFSLFALLSTFPSVFIFLDIYGLILFFPFSHFLRFTNFIWISSFLLFRSRLLLW